MGMAGRDNSDEMLALLRTLPNQLRQGLADQQWSRIPLYIEEYGNNDNQAANVVLAVTAQTNSLELIELVSVSIPTGATGVLQLGRRIFYLSQGPRDFSTQILLDSTAVRTVTSTVAGPVSLWLGGVQLPAFGVLAP